MAPLTIRPAPSSTCHVSFSFRKSAASSTEKTSAVLVSGDTREASPSDSARNVSSDDVAVSTPAATRKIQLFRSIFVISGSSPSHSTVPHDTTIINTA